MWCRRFVGSGLRACCNSFRRGCSEAKARVQLRFEPRPERFELGQTPRGGSALVSVPTLTRDRAEATDDRQIDSGREPVSSPQDWGLGPNSNELLAQRSRVYRVMAELSLRPCLACSS